MPQPFPNPIFLLVRFPEHDAVHEIAQAVVEGVQRVDRPVRTAISQYLLRVLKWKEKKRRKEIRKK